MSESSTSELAKPVHDRTAESRDNAIAILNDAFADRFHSWAEYILEAGPYVGEEDAALRRTVERIAKADRAAAERLAHVIEGLDGIPQVPAYPHRIAELNYLSLDFLRNVLREELTRQLKTYERQLPLLHNCAAARNVLYPICQTLRTHIAELA
jgi:bacterioferritin (cytochrome b1)